VANREIWFQGDKEFSVVTEEAGEQEVMRFR
jgi:hypothetical protein